MSGFNKNAVEVQKCVENLALKNRVLSFYPEAISRRLGVSLDIIIIELEKLCADGLLELKYEIKCSDNFDTVETVKSYKEYLGNNIMCGQCGEVFEVGYNNIYPIYFISNEYREYIKKK